MLMLPFSSTTVSAEEIDIASFNLSEEVVQKYLESDNLYDELNDKNLDKTIQQYTTNDILENGDNSIVQIIPKGYFLKPCVVAKMGKEYGFFIYTRSDFDNYHSQVLVFDLKFSNNGAGEYVYEIEPLFAYWYGTTTSYSSGEYLVGPYNSYQSLSNELFISNVAFGTSLFNENEYNSQDGNDYDWSLDNGPVIYQTKYFDKGYIGSYNNSMEGAVGLINRIGGSILDYYLEDNLYYDYAKKIIKIAKEIYETQKDISLLFENGKIEGGNVDSINENVYKFRNQYDINEVYVRTSLMYPNETVAYGVDKNHYVQEVVSIDVDEKSKDYRIVQNISFDIVNLAFDGSIEKYCEVDSCRIDIIKTQEKKKMIEGEDSLLYTFPQGDISYSFEPIIAGDYSFIGDNTNSAYECYISDNKTNKKVSIDLNTKIYLETGKIYYFDLYSNSTTVEIGTVKLLLDRIEFNETLNKKLLSGTLNAFVYQPTETRIVKLESSNPNIIIKNIYSVQGGDILAINSSEVSFKSRAGYKYTIEIFNTSNTELTTLSLVDINKIPNSFDPSSVWTYFRYDVQSNDTYILSLLYEKSKVGFVILDDNLNNINGPELTGEGFSVISLSVQNCQFIYIGIKDTSNSSENITIALESRDNAYSWIINYGGDIHTYKSGDILEVKQGDTITMGCYINDSIEIDRFIVESKAYAYILNGQELTILENCRIEGDFPVYPALNTEMYDWLTDIVASIRIRPILNQENYELTVWNSNDGFGIQWDGTKIDSLKIRVLEVDQNGNIIKTLYNYNLSSGAFADNKKNNICEFNFLTANEWSYYGLNDIQIIIEELIVIGEDSGGEQKICKVIPNDLNYSYGYIQNNYITHALYNKRLGYSRDGYFEISCERHLRNIRLNSFFDDLDINSYLIGNYSLANDIEVKNPTDIFPLDENCDYAAFNFYGNGFTISNIEILDSEIRGGCKYVGFVKYLRGTIDGLILDQINISTTLENDNMFMCVGGFAGVNQGQIINCDAMWGTINCTSSNMCVGGIVGNNKGTIINAYNRCQVIGWNGNVGGIVGSNYNIIRNCTNGGSIKGNRNVGGIAGEQSNSDICDSPEISGCVTYGAIQYDNKFSDHDCVGGFVGLLSCGKIYNCTSDSEVYIDYYDKSSRTYQPYVGYFIGSLENASFNNCILGDDGCINDYGNLVVVTWKGGFLFLTTYTHDQSAYVGGPVGYTA